jgi:hypothetical protein
MNLFRQHLWRFNKLASRAGCFQSFATMTILHLRRSCGFLCHTRVYAGVEFWCSAEKIMLQSHLHVSGSIRRPSRSVGLRRLSSTSQPYFSLARKLQTSSNDIPDEISRRVFLCSWAAGTAWRLRKSKSATANSFTS